MGASDGFFDTPEIQIDHFADGVEVLVRLAYKAACEGINSLDRRLCPKEAPDDSQVEVEQWETQVSAMRIHAGNMALVSLVCLFDDWLSKHGGFKELPGDALTKIRLEDIHVARNSVIHHRGKPTYEYRGKHYVVGDCFLDFDEVRTETVLRSEKTF